MHKQHKHLDKNYNLLEEVGFVRTQTLQIVEMHKQHKHLNNNRNSIADLVFVCTQAHAVKR